jgi:hypothetical protein
MATHLANLPKWTVMTIAETSFDMEPEGEEPIETVAGAVEMFDAVALGTFCRRRDLSS